MAEAAWRPTKKQVEAARGASLPDLIGPGLSVVFCGINPGLYSAAVGHHFARPGNRFWRALWKAGFSERELSPFEDRSLLRYGCGLTNLAARATARADELTSEELRTGAADLRRKLRQHRPRALAILGIGAYRVGFGDRKCEVGEQPETIAGVRVWVLPSPSGLNAHYQVDDLARAYGEVREALE